MSDGFSIVSDVSLFTVLTTPTKLPEALNRNIPGEQVVVQCEPTPVTLVEPRATVSVPSVPWTLALFPPRHTARHCVGLFSSYCVEVPMRAPPPSLGLESTIGYGADEKPKGHGIC